MFVHVAFVLATPEVVKHGRADVTRQRSHVVGGVSWGRGLSARGWSFFGRKGVVFAKAEVEEEESESARERNDVGDEDDDCNQTQD